MGSQAISLIDAKPNEQHGDKRDFYAFGTMNQMAKRSMMAQVVQFLRHVVPAVLRPIRTLWHEIIGFLFVVLAMWAVPSGIRTIREFNGDLGSVFKVILIGCFILIMAGYGISSFRRARRISRP